MEILKDVILVNKTASEKTIKSLKNGWPLFFVGLIYIVLNVLILNLLRVLFVGPLSIFTGFITLIISSGFISNYLYLLYNLINYNRVTVQNFKDGFSYFLRKIYGVFFLGWVLNIAVSFLTNILGRGAMDIGVIINMSIFLFLNALPETVYLKSYDSGASLSYSLEFMKENWLNWIIPNLIFIAIIYSLTGRIFGMLFQTHMSYGIIFGGAMPIKAILGQILFTIGMIYRGHLFKILSTGNRRKRKFMNSI